MRPKDGNSQYTFESTHPFITRILIFAIIFALVVVITPELPMWDSSPEETPHVGAIYQPYGNNSLALHVEKVDHGPASINDTMFILVNEMRDEITESMGYLNDIRGLDFGNSAVLFSFIDSDNDWTVSAGDVLLAKHHSEGGFYEGGGLSYLIYEPTGERMNEYLCRCG